MAPQVGLEPTTDRLTADSSTTELLRNIEDNLYLIKIHFLSQALLTIFCSGVTCLYYTGLFF